VVPGPQLRAEVGDRIRIILHNDLPVPTTIHSHGLFVPPDMDGVPVISQPAVMPGESFTYEYTLRNAGSHMYHSHFMAEEQVPMGLLGAFVVTDPNASDEPVADVDYTMILNDGPLGFTINGKGFPATEPIVLQQGQTIRIRYMNEGLQIHPMHLHGMPQQVIAKDGWTLPTFHLEDTVLVAPGERVDVIVTATEVGTWAFHCHVLTHAEGPDGMFGMVTAIVVQP
jgi:FtsP/CotA-like multicopper oxidase with cupredoxin domain